MNYGNAVIGVREGNSTNHRAIMALENLTHNKEAEDHKILGVEMDVKRQTNEFPNSKEADCPCLHLPREEVLLSLEEVEEGIQLVGEPLVRPVTPSHILTTTISPFTPEMPGKKAPTTISYEGNSNQSGSIPTGLLQDTQTGVDTKFDEETNNTTEIQEMNGGGLAIEGSSQAWIGCCLCYEVLPSRDALQLHITAVHQQLSSALPHQVSCFQCFFSLVFFYYFRDVSVSYLLHP